MLQRLPKQPGSGFKHGKPGSRFCTPREHRRNSTRVRIEHEQRKILRIKETRSQQLTSELLLSVSKSVSGITAWFCGMCVNLLYALIISLFTIDFQSWAQLQYTSHHHGALLRSHKTSKAFQRPIPCTMLQCSCLESAYSQI